MTEKGFGSGKEERAGLYRLAAVVLATAALLVATTALLNTKRPAVRETAVVDAGPVDFSEAVEAVMPSLVKIENLALTSHPTLPQFGAPGEVPKRAEGAGIFIDSTGLILTNFHVVDDAQVLQVVTREHGIYHAEVIGADAFTDIALIKIKPDFTVKPVVLGDSSKLRIGQWVLAMGNPLGLEFFTSAGIVSGFGPPGPGYIGIYDFIQTDVNIKPGNSGGPLVDSDGRVVGINNAYLGPGTGIGFAIPINRAMDIMASLKEKGEVSRGFMGIIAQPVTRGLAERLGIKGTAGAVISGVLDDSPADKAGLREGDVVLSFDREPVKNERDFYERINTRPEGAEVSLEVVRDGRRELATVVLGKLRPRNILSQRVITQCGITLREVDEKLASGIGLKKAGGLLVLKVIPGCPSFEAGLQFGDVILKVEGVEVDTISDFYREYSKVEQGSQVLIQIFRDGRPQFLTIKQIG